MHLAEGVLPLAQAGGWSVLATGALVWSVRGESHTPQESFSVVMAGATSILFAATLMPLPVPVVGATSHICLTPILGLILGIRRIVWPTFFVLLLQAIFFAHGGLTSLGANTLTLGLVGPLVAASLWRCMQKMGLRSGIGLAISCSLGSLSVYLADAGLLAWALKDLSSPGTTFTGALLGFAPIQVPLAVLEGVVSIGLVRWLFVRRPNLLPAPLRKMSDVSGGGAFGWLLTGTALGLSGCSYEPLDERVFAEAARAVGASPGQPLIDLSQGEMGLACSIIILFGLGFITGRSCERLTRRKHDAAPR